MVETQSRVISIERAAKDYLGIGRSLAYELAQRGEFPVPLIRCGKLYKVPVAALERLVCGDSA